jgi:hypothetical protein
MAGEKTSRAQLEQWINLGATVAAPVTVLSALLFYFGYVSSESEYAYFGINIDTVGLGTQAYIMRSPQTLLVPLLVLSVGSAGFIALSSAVHRRINSAVAAAHAVAPATSPDAAPAADPARGIRQVRHAARWARITGQATHAIGILLLFLYPYVRDWSLYGLVTPILIGSGAGAIVYAPRILNVLDAASQPVPARTAADGQVRARRITGLLLYVLIAASVFWSTATIAQWSGRGLADYTAIHFTNLPSIILDSRERLFLRDPGIEETLLPQNDGQTFHYRYRGLRLLIEGQDRMFLVPGHWSASDSTLIIPLDGSYRIQFQFENQAP